MPAIGTKHRTEKLLVTTKINGPSTKFLIDPNDIISAVKTMTDSEDSPSPKDLATYISRSVAKLVKYDPNVVWVDCEVLQPNGVLFSDAIAIEDLEDEQE